MATATTTVPVTDDGSTSSTAPAAAEDATTSTPTVTSTPPVGIPPTPLPIAIRVSFTLNTTDGLRQISLGLEKDTDGISTDWTLTFVLFERSDESVDFGNPVVSLTVFLAGNLHANAETAAHNGLTPPQVAHVTGPAADAAKAASEGTIPLPVAQTVAANTFNR